jgi:putative restriction endonuclease
MNEAPNHDSARPPVLSVLQRRAAIESGFDLEPEIDSGWWRLRASGAQGVVWVRPLDDEQALLALPLAEQLAALQADRASGANEPLASLPTGAAGHALSATPHALFRLLRRTWLGRQSSAAARLVRWEQEVATALALVRPNTSAGASGAIDTESADGVAPPHPLITEAVAQVRRRIGQDLYREAQLALWGGRCAVTGLAVPELLRASHAKPWAKSTDVERVDPYNGLLLAVHLDALFDQGWLAFTDDGQALISDALPPDARALLRIDESGLALREVHPPNRPFLTWHRSHVFRGDINEQP